jgi:hypothetical protein
MYWVLISLSPDGAPVRWARQDGRPLPSSARVNNGDLLISSPTTEDSGNFVCSLERYPDTMTHVIFTVQNKGIFFTFYNLLYVLPID